MDNFEAFSYLFFDSFLTSFLFATNNDLVFDAMLVFNKYSNISILIFTALGSLFGSIANWLLGHIFRFSEKTKILKDRKSSLKKASKIFNNTPLKFIILLSFIPLWGALITAIAGVLRYRFSHFCLMVMVSKSLYYAYFIF